MYPAQRGTGVLDHHISLSNSTPRLQNGIYGTWRTFGGMGKSGKTVAGDTFLTKQ